MNGNLTTVDQEKALTIKILRLLQEIIENIDASYQAKVAARAGNIAIFDANGNIIDSGYNIKEIGTVPVTVSPGGNESLETGYWEVETVNNYVAYKPRNTENPTEIKATGLTSVENLAFRGNGVTIGANNVDSETQVTISGDNTDELQTRFAFSNAVNVNLATSYVSLETGEGNDTITLTSGAADCTILGGAGQDTIFNNDSDNGHIFQVYNSQNKVIRGFTKNDSIQIMDDTAFTPTVFAATDTDYLPVSIGSGRVSIQGDLYKVPAVPILDKDGNLIGKNNASGVVIKSPDTTIATAGQWTTVQGCNCSVTGSSGADSIVNDCDGVTIIGNGAGDYIRNTNTGDKGNTYVAPIYNGAFTFTIDGMADNDNLVVNYAQANCRLFSYCNVNIATNGITLGGAGYNLNNIYYVLNTQQPFYDEYFKYTTIDSTKGGTIGSAQVACTFYYSGTSPYVNDHCSNLNVSTATTITNNKVGASIQAAGGNLIANAANTKFYTTAAASITANAPGCTIAGSGANDSININASNCSLNCGAGNDTINVAEGTTGSTVITSLGNDFIQNNSNGNIYVFVGGTSAEGDDTISAWGSNDIIYHANKNITASDVTDVAGGVKLTFRYNTVYTYVTMLGVYRGTTIKYQNPSMTAPGTWTIP